MSALLALLSSALWGTSDFLGGLAARRAPVAAVVVGGQALALLLLLPFVLLLAGPPSAEMLVPALAAGAVGAVALAAFYRALAVGTAGVVAPIAALGVAVPFVAGLLAGERPVLWALVGAAVATAGVVMAGGVEVRRGTGSAVALALVAAVGFGSVLLLLARASRAGDGSAGDLLLVLALMRAAGAAVAVVVAVAGRVRPLPPRAALPLVAVVGIGDVAANAAYAAASRLGLVSTTSVLASLYPVVTALLARQVLKERLTRLQGCGAVLALVGVVLLAYPW